MQPARCFRLVLVPLLAALPLPPAAVAGPFDVDGKAPERVVITPGDERPDPLPPQRADTRSTASAMHLALAGVAADLEPRQIAALRALATAGGGAKPGPLADELQAKGTLLFTAHGSRDGRWIAARVYRLPDGAVAVADAGPGSLRLDPARLAPHAMDWPMAAAGVDPGVPPGDQRQVGPGQLLPLERSLIALDQRELGRRFLNGRPSRIAPSAVDPAADGLVVRTPRSLGPWSRLGSGPDAAPGLPGLLVWIDAAPRARLPEQLLPACDELNLILVAPLRCGNDRPTADRQQLALDAVASVRRRWFIDPERVYVSGISGGGKISTHLWAGCTDVFRGAVPVVGLANYKTIMLPNNLASPPDYMLPTDAARLAALRQHRCAVMTGPPDFNYEPILSTARQMTADGLPVRVFEYPDMAHELPAATRFADALRWVDEPARQRRTQAAAKARQMIEALDRSLPPTREQLHARLHAVIAQAPFSPAAWEAAERLRLTGRPTPP